MGELSLRRMASAPKGLVGLRGNYLGQAINMSGSTLGIGAYGMGGTNYGSIGGGDLTFVPTAGKQYIVMSQDSATAIGVAIFDSNNRMYFDLINPSATAFTHQLNHTLFYEMK